MTKVPAKKPKTQKKNIRTVGELVLCRRCVTFPQHASISSILPVLKNQGVDAAGVVDEDGRLIGLLTERGIVRRIFDKATDPETDPADLQARIRDMRVREVMIPTPATLDESMDLEEAMGVMLRHSYNFMPVVSRFDRRRLLGIINEKEIAAYLKLLLQQMRRTEAETQSILSYAFYEPYGEGFKWQ